MTRTRSHLLAFAAGVLVTLLAVGGLSELLRREPAPAGEPVWAKPTKRIARAEWVETDLLRVRVPDLSPKLAARISRDYGEPVAPASAPEVGTVDPATGRAVLGLLGEFEGAAYPWGFDEIVVHRPGEPVGVVRKARPEPRVLLSPRARLGLWVGGALAAPADAARGVDAGAFARWDLMRLKGGRYLGAELEVGTFAAEPVVLGRLTWSWEWDRTLARNRRTDRPSPEREPREE